MTLLDDLQKALEGPIKVGDVIKIGDREIQIEAVSWPIVTVSGIPIVNPNPTRTAVLTLPDDLQEEKTDPGQGGQLCPCGCGCSAIIYQKKCKCVRCHNEGAPHEGYCGKRP